MPTLREERRLLRAGHVLVAGMDEVGRGALAGPVSVGVVVVDARVRTAPSGVRDSKLLTPAVRQALVPRLRRWALACAVGHAEPEEIDRYGIIAALRLAGRRALAALPLVPTCVLLDGAHDWLSPPRPRRSGGGPADEPVAEPIITEPLFELDFEPVPLPEPVGLTGPTARRHVPPEVPLSCQPEVLTMIKADLRCAAVAAASVLAKVERDSIMVARSADYPRYRWHDNKGYSAPEHLAALAAEGPCEQHRRSWSLPGVPSGDDVDPALLGGDLFSELLDDELDDEGLDDEGPDDEGPDDEGPDDEGLPGCIPDGRPLGEVIDLEPGAGAGDEALEDAWR